MKTLMMMLVLMLGASQDHGKVTKFLRDTVAVYDKDGNPQGRVPKWPLPSKGEPIVGTNAAGQIGIRRGGDIVFLRSSEILTEGAPAPCAPAAQGVRPAGKVAAASGGIGSGMSSSTNACTR